MDEGVTTRALFVGVGIFLTLIIVGSLVTYYNAARDTVKSVHGVDYETMYRDDITSELLLTNKHSQINGTQVKNLLNYFYNDISIEIHLSGIKYIDENGDIAEYEPVNFLTDNVEDRIEKYQKVYKYITNNQNFTFDKNDDDEFLTIIYIKGE